MSSILYLTKPHHDECGSLQAFPGTDDWTQACVCDTV